MKTLPLIALFAALAATPAFGQSHAGTHDTHAAAPAPKTAEGVGVVKAVNTKAGKLTLHHGPVRALGWPAMTMDFKAAPQILEGVKPGQKVKFTVVDGEEPEITALSRQ